MLGSSYYSLRFHFCAHWDKFPGILYHPVTPVSVCVWWGGGMPAQVPRAGHEASRRESGCSVPCRRGAIPETLVLPLHQLQYLHSGPPKNSPRNPVLQKAKAGAPSLPPHLFIGPPHSSLSRFLNTKVHKPHPLSCLSSLLGNFQNTWSAG